MPIYEYKCRKCGDVYEVKQSFSDTPLANHDGCGGAVERLISAPAIQFKGSGWYVTDYARKGASSNGKNGGSKSETSAETKTETKSDSSSTTSSSSDKK